ncbi:hypothetical protein DSL72_002945 [Monilinia vaccinii-corymbosi]|uniref:Uncharacterized protein n=1 Tax=Monilinia vaccinii-corymbosi TaxID=61207 RepID=A0A8A3PDT7_9HELO|nr:hypothetical protein DSL72_002945 [Monilinia vaccinii-corymbosi]
MAHTTKGNVEILVHTSAPSRGQDDVRYRAFARAYLDFKPATSLQLQDNPRVITENEEELDVQTQRRLLHPTQEYDENASYCPSTQDPETNPGGFQHEITGEELSELMDSPQLSFRSVLDNRNSPMFRNRNAVDFEMQSRDQMRRQIRFRSSLSAQGEPSNVIEDSMSDDDRILPELSSPTRILEHHLQQGQSTQDSPDMRRGSQFTDESSLNLEVPQAMPVSSSRSGEARINLQLASSLSSRRCKAISPPPRQRKTRYRDVTTFPIPSHTTAAPSTMNSDNFPASRQPMDSLNPRTSQNMETGGTAIFPNEEINPARTSKSGPISGTPEIPETSSALPRHANSKRQRVDFPSSIDKSPRRVKLVISDTTGETSSASLAIPQTSTFKSPEVAFIPSFMPSISSSPSPESMAICTIPQITPPTSSDDLTPAKLITPSLEILKSIPGIQKVFNPTSQTRACLPFERGYWLIDTQALDRKEHLWSYLSKHISGGFSGWGVSAERSEDWKNIRVNCWGGVIKEIYLLLFIACDGKMKGRYACWKDGGGETVISWT